MKKMITWVCLSMLPMTYAAAEGYQVNAQSTKQAGMAHVGAAMKLGAESMHFNPAGLVFMDKDIHLSAGVAGVFTNASYETADKTYSFDADSKASTPLYLYAGFKIYDNLAAGVSLTTPFGNGIRWGDNWKGAHLIQEINLKAFNIQPAVSWKILDNLSIGAGLMMEFGNISLSRALIGPGAMSGLADGLIAQNPALGALIPESVKETMAKYDDVSAASVALKGNSDIRFGFNVGAMYDINEKWTVGVSYRSKVTAKVKEGEIALAYANETEFNNLLNQVNGLIGMLPPSVTEDLGLPEGGIQVPPLNRGTFRAELPLPDNWSVGVTYRPTVRWTVSGEVQFVGWGAYDVLNIYFSPSDELGQYDIHATKQYHNSRIYRLGGQFAATDRLDLRMGVYYDESPVEDNYLNPETPSMDKLGITAGFSFRPDAAWSVDFAFSYITGFGRDGSYTDTDLLGQPRTFGGHYKAYALMPSVGVSYAF